MRIALCGQLGAGCTEIANIIATKTGATVLNSEAVIRQIARAETESFRELQNRIFSGEVDIDRLVQSQLQEAVDENENIIVEGRSGFMLLDDESFFKVLLVAPDESRTKHIMTLRKITLEEARDIVRHSDAERRGLVERFFEKDWLSATNYHIVLNTGPLKFELAAHCVQNAYNTYAIH